MIKTEFYQNALEEIKYLNTPDFVVDYKAEPYFKVNLNTREVIVPADFRNIGVKGDHKAETIWFAVHKLPVFNMNLKMAINQCFHFLLPN